MPKKILVKNLPGNLKTMYESEKKWRTKAWGESLNKHKDELERMLEKVNLLDIWSDGLRSSEASRPLLQEIFMDAYISIHLTCYGLYKYANICLRSELETTLRLIYFSTHPVEFNWWHSGNEWYRSGLANKDVWGEGYKYFQELEHVKKFESKCNKGLRLFCDGKKVSNIYKKLSAYVHSGTFSFQTKPDQFSPQYKTTDFKHWSSNFNEVQEYINTLLILGFLKEFRQISEGDKKRILEVGINNSYRTILKEILGP